MRVSFLVAFFCSISQRLTAVYPPSGINKNPAQGYLYSNDFFHFLLSSSPPSPRQHCNRKVGFCDLQGTIF
jgi:hypothetical protein